VRLKFLWTNMCRKRKFLPTEGIDVSSSFIDPRITAIAGHLRGIENELSGIGKSTGRRAVASASSAGGQIAAALGPILNEVVERFSRGQRVAVDHAASFSDEAVNVGARFGNDALGQIATRARACCDQSGLYPQ
jgi:hypothetical protein